MADLPTDVNIPTLRPPKKSTIGFPVTINGGSDIGVHPGMLHF
jgi:hypothetical protein